MPELTMVESCRVSTARSRSLTRSRNDRLISTEPFLASIPRGISPRCLSWSVTACLDSASTSPLVRAPARSIALNAYWAMPFAPYAAAAMPDEPSSRRSSSGLVERDSASWRVILPERTSVASDASIVCIPAAALVCSTE